MCEVAPYGLTDEAVIGLNLNYRDISSLLYLHPSRIYVYSIFWKIEIFEKNVMYKNLNAVYKTLWSVDCTGT